MKIEVDWDLCEGNATCVDHCPEVFRVDDDDQLHLTESAVSEALRHQIERAVSRCPRQALKLVNL